MNREKLEKYREAFETLDELMDDILQSAGESWWQLPKLADKGVCEYSGEMGYVDEFVEFWSDLRSYLFVDVEE